MIPLTRLNGDEFVLNCDMIERIEAHPDTHLLLTDGTKYVVRESPAEIIREAQVFRAGVLALVGQVDTAGGQARPELTVVPSHDKDGN